MLKNALTVALLIRGLWVRVPRGPLKTPSQYRIQAETKTLLVRSPGGASRQYHPGRFRWPQRQQQRHHRPMRPARPRSASPAPAGKRDPSSAPSATSRSDPTPSPTPTSRPPTRLRLSWARASAAACAQLRRPSFIKMFETWESTQDGASSRSSTCADLSVECTRWLGFGPQSGRLL